MPRVSVVIPVYNRAHLIGHAIHSVLAQTYRDVEIIVCDDASTDETLEVVESIKVNANLPLRLEALPCNIGVSAARNHGIYCATGELIAFLDSDDTWKPQKLTRQVAFLDAHPQHAGVGSRTSDVAGTRASKVSRAANSSSDEINELFSLLYDCYILTSCFLVKKHALILAGLFDVRLKKGEDRDLWWRLPRFGRLGFIDEPLIDYKEHAESLSVSQGGHSGKTYLASIDKSISFWTDHLTSRQKRHIMAKAHFDVATDAAAARHMLPCIQHALTTMAYCHLPLQAARLIASVILTRVVT